MIASETWPRVLMITGAYHPDASGASRQCRQLIASLKARAAFRVLTTTTTADLPDGAVVDDVPVRRVYVNPDSALSKAAAIVRLTLEFFRVRRDVDIVHLHGFSQKSLLVIVLARLLGKMIVIKLTSFGQDDPLSMRGRRAAFAFFRRADAFIGVSPAFAAAYRESGLPEGRFHFVPNGVDLQRFRPVANRDAIVAGRHALGLPTGEPIVLFVGFFSTEKRPDALYRAWQRVSAEGLSSTLVFVGATGGLYHEIDPEMAPRMRRDAEQHGLANRMVFVERTEAIDDYYRAADVFVLPTSREGLPNVLLEAMASGVPPVVTRLAGVTDWLLEDGVHGRLVAPGDDEALTAALRELLADPERRVAMGRAAREHAAAHFGSDVAAARTLAVYNSLLTAPNTGSVSR